MHLLCECKENERKKKESRKMLKFSFLSQHHAMNIKNYKPAAIFIENTHIHNEKL